VRATGVWLAQPPLADVGVDEESVVPTRVQCGRTKPSRGHGGQHGVRARPTPTPATRRRANDNSALAAAASSS